jgi:hypothetical protein
MGFGLVFIALVTFLQVNAFLYFAITWVIFGFGVGL